MSKKYQQCNRCVMDTSDPKIVFDENGVCDHCLDFEEKIKPNWVTDESKRFELEKIVDEIKKKGKNNDFDCLLGLSGGVDSSYMLHLMVKEFDLRPLVFHVDGGWNSELAVHNINALIDKLELDLYTEVINWEEMKDFQLAWFKSGCPHLDIPQDHAFIATLYNFANKHGISYILNGGNISTECVRYPLNYYYYGTDMRHIKHIISKFGTVPMKSYPFSSIYRHKIYLRYIKRLKVFKPLNYVPFTKKEAFDLLKNEYNWKPYPQKHFESRFTRFFEGYWLPERFGFDVRKVQLSSLILTGQISRDEALAILETPPFDDEEIRQDFEYIATKMGVTVDQLKEYQHMEKKYYWDYPNERSIFKIGDKLLGLMKLDRAGVR